MRTWVRQVSGAQEEMITRTRPACAQIVHIRRMEQRELKQPGRDPPALPLLAMADLVHLTPEGNVRRIVRAGIAARSHSWSSERGIYCSPLLPSFEATYQWVRELRRWKPAVMVAVHLRLPDEEPVTIGH